MITRANASQPASPLVDLSVVTLLGAVLYGLVRVARHWQAPLLPNSDIDLSFLKLPVYTLLSLLRGFVAYGLSFVFTLAYGYTAVYRPKAGRVMIPLLDILQSIPVLGFLPAAVMALVSLFPHSNAGLELACILMIFTGQVWNMTFSFYQSLRTIPLDLREVSSLYQFNWWQRFRRMELPAAAVGLAWNSMMAMAGGWFFLMVCEAFTLGSHDFRLPGLGAYISVAIARHNMTAVWGGLLAMVVMIVLVDTCVWRPILVWSQKFRIEDTAASEAQSSVVLRWFQRSWLIHAALGRVVHPISEKISQIANREPSSPAESAPRPLHSPGNFLALFLLAAGFVVAAWSAVRLLFLLAHLNWGQWALIAVGALLTFVRVATAIFLGSLWTVPVGVWVGRSPRFRSRLQPFVQVAASFPAPMLYPLVLLALHQLGIGLGVGSIVLMLLGTQWYLLFNVIAGASSVPEDLKEAAQAYHFTARQCWKILWWPAVFPYLVTGWVTAAGGAWNASIVAEYVSTGSDRVSSTAGLGSLISLAASQGRYDLLAAGVLTMAVVVVMINRCVWKKLYHLAETRYAY